MPARHQFHASAQAKAGPLIISSAENGNWVSSISPVNAWLTASENSTSSDCRRATKAVTATTPDRNDSMGFLRLCQLFRGSWNEVSFALHGPSRCPKFMAYFSVWEGLCGACLVSARLTCYVSQIDLDSRLCFSGPVCPSRRTLLPKSSIIRLNSAPLFSGTTVTD